MIWVLTVSVILLGLLVFWQHHRIGALDFALQVLDIQVRVCSSPEYHELQQRIAASMQVMHDTVLRARATGDLDLANRMMELQRWADCNYDAQWLDGMFRGFP